jgi:hypothetical protein
MESVGRTTIVRYNEASSEESSHSFHGLLLTRSRECLASRRRGPLARFKGRKPSNGLGTRLHRKIGEAAIFAGGAAIGAGVMLLSKGEPVLGLGRPATVIAVGLGLIPLVILARLMTNSRMGAMTHAGRG